MFVLLTFDPVTALLSFFVALFGAFLTDWAAIMEEGFFQGYSPIVGTVICLQVRTHQGI